MSGEATDQRIDPATPGQNLGAPQWLLAGGAVLALALLACLTFGQSAAEAAFPGINGKLFCQEGSAPGPATKAQNIFSINPDGTGRTLVTNTTVLDPANPAGGFANNSNVRVSPDGRNVVFTSNRVGNGLYVMNADGTGPATRLTDPATATGGFADLSSSWSPDGTKIFFTRSFPAANGEIYAMNADGSNQVNLTNIASQEVAPVMSPDGRKILFHSNLNPAPLSPGDRDIYSMNPDGSNVQNVTNDSISDRNDLYPNWSPDGTQFVFERLTTNFANSNIYKMNADGTGLTQLTFAISGLNRFPVWSPDGTRISFDSIRDTLPAPDPQNREVYTMNTDGSDVRRVTNAPLSDSQCDWQTIPRPAAIVPPPAAIAPTPVPPTPVPTEKFTAKLSLARATINRNDRVLDVLAPITSLASGRVDVELHAAGRRFRFTAPINSRDGRIRFRKQIPAAQANMGTGILTIGYRGDGDTRPQAVRLRAANQRADLQVTRPTLAANGRLRASGRISSRARGVVRVQLEYVADGKTTTLPLRAPISNGRWSLNEQLSQSARDAIARRSGTVHSYTLFTGYLPERMRGEMRSLQVLGPR